MAEPTLQQLIDAWGDARTARLEAQRTVDQLEKGEKELKALVIAGMKFQKMSSCGGQRRGANYKAKQVPTAGDWRKIYDWIKENDAFDILHKRLTDTAIKAREEDGIIIPGIVTIEVDDITMFTP